MTSIVHPYQPMSIQMLNADKTRKILLIEFFGSCLITLLIIAVYELELILPGAWADVESSNMVTVQFLMQLLTLATIPLALFLFKIGYVHSDLHTDESHVSRKLLFWGSVRIMMLCVPMILNTFFYYAFGDSVSFFYLAVILALSLFFVFPNKKRCEHECSMDNSEQA